MISKALEALKRVLFLLLLCLILRRGCDSYRERTAKGFATSVSDVSPKHPAGILCIERAWVGEIGANHEALVRHVEVIAGG